MQTTETASTPPKPDPTLLLTTGQKCTIALVVALGLGLFGSAVYVFLRPGPAKVDVVAEAEKYVRFRKGAPLSEPLEKILADPDLFIVESETHPLIGKKAPDFRLRNVNNQLVRLENLLQQGPVVLVFYYGFYCDHCVAQLFSINEDLAKFKELGATVVAVSSDSPAHTREKLDEFRRTFHFDLLSDPHNEVAKEYGVYEPAAAGKEETLWHGTFVIGRDGIVHWVDRGHQPFIHNQTLLYQLARLDGRLPPSAAAKPTTKANPSK
jgi:peroxiredoxin